MDVNTGTRKLDTFATKDVLLDAQIAGNTPVTAATSVRTTHVDHGSKLFSGLFYMRSEGDNSVGGDLTISRFKPEYSLEERLGCFSGAYVDDRHVETLKTIRYSRNCLVLMINSLDSLHGVTIRRPTPHDRLFVNLIAEIDAPLYRLSQAGGLPRYLEAPPAVERLELGS
jgi:hypothetical protein